MRSVAFSANIGISDAIAVQERVNCVARTKRKRGDNSNASKSIGMKDMKTNLESLIQIAGLPVPVVEYRFDLIRKWRFDFAWPEFKTAVEQEGGTFVNGRHNRPRGYSSDCEKYNCAQMLGWRVFRFTADMIADGRALECLQAISRQRIYVKD